MREPARLLRIEIGDGGQSSIGSSGLTAFACAASEPWHDALLESSHGIDGIDSKKVSEM